MKIKKSKEIKIKPRKKETIYKTPAKGLYLGYHGQLPSFLYQAYMKNLQTSD